MLEIQITVGGLTVEQGLNPHFVNRLARVLMPDGMAPTRIEVDPELYYDDLGGYMVTITPGTTSTDTPLDRLMRDELI